MATYQQKQRARFRSSRPASINVAAAVQSGEFVLSLSSMLGCDYIFVTHKAPHSLFASSALESTIRELLDLMETSPQQSMVISVFEKDGGPPVFTRLEYTWTNRHVSNVIATRVTQADQIEFMHMMLSCSSIR